MTEADHAPPHLRRAPAERAARALLPACGTVWTAAEIMHACGVPGLDIGIGTVVAGSLAYGKGWRRTAAGLAIAGAWSAAAVRYGPAAGPYLALTDTWALLSFGAWRWARSHPAVVAARDKRNARADWLARRNRWGLAGTHLLDWQETRLGEWYLADVRGSGKRASAVVNSDAAERIAEDLDLPPSRVRLRRHRLAGRVEISVRMTDPWARPIPHPAVTADHEIDLSGPYSITQPAVVGQDPETGEPLSLLLCGPGGGRNVNIVATLDSGKTTLLSCISERVTAACDALLVRVNISIKGDSERALWAPACHLTALGPREKSRAFKVLTVIAAIVEWRSQQPKTSANWAPSREDPHIVLIIDEIDALAEIPACKTLLEHLASKGREFGITIVRAGQRGTAGWTGGGNVRAMDGVFCLGRVNRSMEAMHAAGEIGLQLPDMAEYGEGRPGVWGIADLAARGHEAGRGFDLSEPDDVRSVVAQRAHDQPDLQPELKAFLNRALSGMYEELLSTDVFARWARGQDGRRPAVAYPRPDMEPGPMAAEPGPAPVAVLTDDSLAALDQELNAVVPDDLRSRWLKQGERLEEIRRDLAETAKQDIPDIPHDQQVAYAEAQWKALGEATEIPAEARGPLLSLLAAGTTISEVASTLGVSKWTARTYLERLRTERLVRMEGEKRTARWLLNQPEGGDGS